MGKRRVGRPREQFLMYAPSLINSDLKRGDVLTEELANLARERTKWRELVIA